MDVTAAEWAERLSAKGDTTAGRAACELAQSLRDKTINPDVVRALMRHSDEGIRREVAWALYEVVHNIGNFLPIVFDGLDDPSTDVRYWCVLALRQVPAECRVEAMVRAFGLLEDDDAEVRRAAADVLQRLGSRALSRTLADDPTALREFAAALSADPKTFGIGVEKATRISHIQEQLRLGYDIPLPSSADREDDQTRDGLAQVGYGIGLGHRCTELALLIARSLSTLPPDVRSVLIYRGGELLEVTLTAVGSLATDSDPQIRRRSWLVLRDAVGEIEKWQRKIPTAARDDDKMVWEACLSTLVHSVEPKVISAVVDTCRDLNNEGTCREALAALKHMVREAASVVKVNSDVLKAFVRGLDNPTLSTDIREELSLVLRSYAEIFQHRVEGFNWAELSTRTLDGVARNNTDMQSQSS